MRCTSSTPVRKVLEPLFNSSPPAPALTNRPPLITPSMITSFTPTPSGTVMVRFPPTRFKGTLTVVAGPAT